MKKIPSVFQRNYDTDRLIRDEVVPGCEWVLAGEGIATRKWDGTCCMISDEGFFRRYDAKKGKTPPTGFIPAMEPDEVTGHATGWIKVGDEPESKWHMKAYVWAGGFGLQNGTYEAVGPHFNGNPEGLEHDTLVPHGLEVLDGIPRDFLGIREALRPLDIEGVVFWHPDGRMAKVKKRDFGLSRKP